MIIEDIKPAEAWQRLDEVVAHAKAFIDRHSKRQSYYDYWMSGYDREMLRRLSAEVELIVDYLGNSRNQLVINKLMDYPIIRSLFFYRPLNNRIVGWVVMVCFPLGLAGYMIGVRQQALLMHDVRMVVSVSEELKGMYAKEIENIR